MPAVHASIAQPIVDVAAAASIAAGAVLLVVRARRRTQTAGRPATGSAS